MHKYTAPAWASTVYDLSARLTEDFGGGPRHLKLAWVIDLHKIITLFIIYAMMARFDNFSTAAWVYLGLLFAPNLLLVAIGVTPAVDNPAWANQFGWLVFMFGVGYYWASRDLAANRQIIRLAIPAKLGVAAVAAASILAGDISWQILLAAGCDVIWAALFCKALQTLPRGDSGSVA